MFSKSNLLATLAGFFVLYLLGWLYYGMLAQDFYQSHTLIEEIHKAESGMNAGLIAVGSVLISFFMATIYGKWARGHHSAKEGFQLGALIGALLGIGLGFIMYATSNFMDSTGTMVDGIWSVLYYGLAGMVIAMVYKATTNTAE